MDTSKLKRTALIVFTCLAAACGRFPEVKEKPKPAPTSTPISAPAEPIKKATNVSFDTYSKEWPKNWQWIDPDFQYAPTGRDITKGVLKVTVPKGKDLTDQLRTAPRFVKAITGDFQIETRVRFKPAENFQGAGLLLYRDDLNYIRLLHAFGGEGGGGAGILIDIWQNGEHKTLTTTSDVQTDTEEIDLRISRLGSSIAAFWRLDENGEWREAGSLEFAFPETIFAGIVACNRARETTITFEHIKLLPAGDK